jgi:hypothetical protein
MNDNPVSKIKLNVRAKTLNQINDDCVRLPSSRKMVLPTGIPTFAFS